MIQPSAPLHSSNVTAAFNPKEVLVLFFLGGPGSGKGTQSELLVKDYGFKHLSAGDLLREEQDRKGSEYGEMIKSYIKEGQIVPMEVTVKLLENAMKAELESGKQKEHPSGEKARFLIDGFPRKMDQAVFFEETVCPSKCTIFLDCPEDVMEARLINRGKTSGRSDDNEESIRKRFKVFVETSMPVVDYFSGQGKVIRASATGSVDEVYQRVKSGLDERGIHPSK